MKKLLSLALVIALITLALPTATLADPAPPSFNFANLVTVECDVIASMYNNPDVAGTLKQGFWVAAIDSSSLDGILSTSTLNGLPVLFLKGPKTWTYIWPVAQESEKDRIVKMVNSRNGVWETSDWRIYPTSEPIRRTTDSETIGYTAKLSFIYMHNESFSRMHFYISDDNTVYPVIISMSVSDSTYEPVWEEYWPKNNEELTNILRETLGTTEDYTFFTTPNFGSGKKKEHTNLLYLPITATAGEGGQITEPGEKLFRPGDISQEYTVTANDGYTIYYIQVDGKTVSNSVNCGDTATFNFDCIYGPRSISAVFMKK